ncbi:putative serine/threonine-protein kinase fhkC [Hypsizygus marmoreus]|uniref:Serine/threonine-protein kinase fhkC n=1 Tax=Hypsizygus marmoreus TaxID=39966 RepID=A0A369KB73_HYPMA|nr:putative serine/threonine-protein kinase fhkC [Hypsizygus marmoreus]
MMDVWGYLVPHRIDCQIICLSSIHVRVGRSLSNDVVLPHLELDTLLDRDDSRVDSFDRPSKQRIHDDASMPAGHARVLTDGRNFNVGHTTGSIDFTYRDYNKKKINLDYRYYVGEMLALCLVLRFKLISLSLGSDLVMELVVNGNLLDYLMKTDGMFEYKAKQVSWDYLHSCGIAHRDLKPENVLVVSLAPLRVKIADFGLAKIFHEGTMLRSLCGTPNHMAPEIWLTTDVPEYGLAVDSWSMGVMTFIMLSCYFPFLYDDDEIVGPLDFFCRRQIQWQCLPEEVTWRARDFIQRLLVHDASRRLSFEVALNHAWFLDLVPRRGSSQTTASTSTREVEEVREVLVDV